MLDEEAKAAQEIAKTTGKAIDASREIGSFLSKILGGGFQELGLSFRDWCVYFRYTHFLKIRDRVEAIHEQRQLQGKSIPIPAKYAIPIIEHASLEDDEAMQDLWAGLIANATDPENRFEVKRIYIDILSALEPLDVMLLKMLSSKIYIGGVSLLSFWSEVTSAIGAKIMDRDFLLSIHNLSRLGLLIAQGGVILDGAPPATAIGLRLYDSDSSTIGLSPLAYALIEACEAKTE